MLLFGFARFTISRKKHMSRYPAPLLLLHWLTVVAVIVAYATSGDPSHAKSEIDTFVGQIHVASGLFVAALTGVRLPLRLIMNAPQAEPACAWIHRAATAMQWLLYALMMVVPLAGMAALAGKVQTFTVAGFALPMLNAQTVWVSRLGDAHQTIGNLFVSLAGAHAIAALWHHFWVKDNTLRSMLPRGR